MIEMYRKAGQWRWRMKHRNGRIIGAASEAYQRRAACLRNLNTVTQLGLTIDPKLRGNSIRWSFPQGFLL